MSSTETLRAVQMLTHRDKTAGFMLLGIVYGLVESNAKVAGKDWVARSRKEWAEALGFSITQVDQALAKLDKLKLIEREQHLVANANILHVRLTPACDALLTMVTASSSPTVPISAEQPLPQDVNASLGHEQAQPPDKKPHWSKKLATMAVDPEKPGFMNKVVKAAQINPPTPGSGKPGGVTDAGDSKIGSSPAAGPKKLKSQKTAAELAAILLKGHE